MGVSTIQRRSVGAVALATAALLFAGPLTEQHAVAAVAVQPEAASMQKLINQARSKVGRRVLKLNARLSRVALKHSQRMASKDNLHHNPRLAKDVGDMPWKILGENVGVGQTVQSLHTAFMNSPAHRRNNLDKRFRLVGIGSVHANGRLWITVVFYG